MSTFSAPPFPPPAESSEPPDLRALHRGIQRILRSYKLSSFSHAFTRDAVMVATLLRRTVLLDFALPPAALDSLLTSLHRSHAVFAPLRWLRLHSPSSHESAVFLIHRQAFLQEDRSTPDVIDIDPKLTAPRLLPSDLRDAVNTALHDCSRRIADALERSSSFTVEVKAPLWAPLPTLCGFLLSYPAVYAFGCVLGSAAQATPSTNCLSSQPLLLYSVYCHPSAALRSASPSFALSRYLCLSFSVPRALAPLVRTDWAQPAAATAYFSHISTEMSDVCPPHVSV